MAILLQQVAAAAGVSLNTASRAIRENCYVPDGARVRLRESAERLHYQSDVLERRMRGARARLPEVFVNAIDRGVVHELVGHSGEEARRLDFDLGVVSAANSDDHRRIGSTDALSGLCDGLPMLLPDREDTFLGALERNRSNCALASFAAREIGLPVAVVDNRAAGRIAAGHLLRPGHRRIAFIQGSRATGQSAERVHAYSDALLAAGIAVDPDLIALGNVNPVIVREATSRLMDMAEPPTAISIANDGMAMTVMETLRGRGLRVPEDVSPIGFDDMPLASYAQPALTTLREPARAMALRAVHKLLAMIDSAQFESEREMFMPELVVRGSTGPVSPC